MARVLIAFGTTEGQPAKIADFVPDVLLVHGHEVTLADLTSTDPAATEEASPEDPDGVIVGSSIHMG